MNRRVLLEMTVHQEQDVLKIEPVAAVSSKETENLENKDLRDYVLNIIKNVQTNYQISEYDMAVLIKHHCSHRTLKKAALLAIPYVLNANMVTASWTQKREEGGRLVKGKDRKPTGMVSAPILIDGTKYLCSITTKKNAQNVMIPYALVLKDANMNIIEGEKMVDSSNVPDSSNPNAALGQSDLNKATTSHESPPSFQDANLQQNNNTTKENNQENINCERNMNKNRIRLTESQLHKVIKESVKRVLREFDEYDEFDQNSDVGEDMDTWRLYRKVENGEISDEQLKSLVRKHGSGDLKNLYDLLKGDGSFPKFEKEMEIDMSYEKNGLEHSKAMNPGRGYGDTLNWGTREYADAEHENGNRLENPFDVLRKSGKKTIGKRIYNPVTMSDDGYEDEDKTFNGTRASLKKYGY